MESRRIEKVKDYVAEEKPLHIFVNRTQYATILCNPKELEELAVGHLLSEGIIKTVDEIAKITLEEGGMCHVNLKPQVNLEARLRFAQPFSRIILSACGGPYQPQAIRRIRKVGSKLAVKAATIQNCVNNLNHMAETFRKTGGVHAAAVYKADGTLVAFAEDVGRHNAVDKAIGKCALDRTPFNECFLALSGRLTADIVLKAARVGIPIVASLAAALDSGIEIAKKANITLVGFVRGRRMNVYNALERIVFD
ncbi:MAG: formate dehydrogenase accessory sulfurtransferase FdhD [Nitrososphaerota archaeon]|nr:formate dehydrogenase accessory sulfurtransferase FdhD [Candidatus Bathyarchaeota archaeon]MDW8024064.1 formate dehydrogenase accessory sulfurtransferase FdhD [Nitrososphaerota archaeon]